MKDDCNTNSRYFMRGPERSVYEWVHVKCIMLFSLNILVSRALYLYRLTTQVASWTEDIELRDNNHLLIIMHCKAVMTCIFHSDEGYVKRH